MPTLNWIGKEKVINHHQDVPYKILEPQYNYELGMENEEFDKVSQNKIIHGDNLEALKSLLPEYEGKVKCIYIDPPYNTGNEGWVYNDNVNHPKLKKWLGQVVGKESEDLSRHDKWLCMMYPRLKLLHKLLADDGAIFISIDDNEQANLKLVCDEIFGVGNFIGSFIWNKKNVVQNDARFYSANHEYIVTYKKNKLERFNLLPRTDEANARYKNPDNDPRGVWTSVALQAKSGSKDNLYESTFSNGVSWKPVEGTFPRLNKESLQKAYDDKRLWFGKSGKNVPRLKKYLSEVSNGMVSSSLLPNSSFGSTQYAKEKLKSILQKNIFDTPKPDKLIEALITLSSDKNSVILDSFAGSGTTAHAVLNLNKQDGGNRKFILVEMEEYANTITAERVKRVINGYGEGSKTVEGTGGDFTYYELGQPLFKADKMLNEEVPLLKIQEYVWYTETKSNYESTIENEAYLLGKKNDAAYYFYYEKERLTTLDESYLRTLKTKASQYIIYADLCLLDQKLMDKYHIVFKKIPRDITRF